MDWKEREREQPKKESKGIEQVEKSAKEILKGREKWAEHGLYGKSVLHGSERGEKVS